jgi:hypothetical protein
MILKRRLHCCAATTSVGKNKNESEVLFALTIFPLLPAYSEKNDTMALSGVMAYQ